MPHGQLRWPPPRQPRGQGAWTERGRASSHHRPSPPLPFARGPHFSFRPHSGNLLGAGPQHPKLFHHKGLRSLPEAPASLGARGRTEGARRPLGSGLRPVSSGSRRPGPPQQTPSPRPPAGKPAPAHLAPQKRRLLPDLRVRAVCPSPSPRSRTLSIPRVRPSPYTSRKPCPVPRPLLGALALSAGAQASYAREQRSCSLPLSFSLREPARRRRRVNTCLLTGRRSRAAPSSPKGGEQHGGGGGAGSTRVLTGPAER